MKQKAVITRKLEAIFDQKGLTSYSLAKLIGYNDSSMSQMFYGRKKIPDNVINKIAPILGVSADEIRVWALASKYSQETIKRALVLQKEHAKSGEKVTVIKLCELMDANNLNLREFAEALDYNPTQLSQVKLGNASISKKLVPKLVAFSGLPEDEILSWLVADRYPAKILRLAEEGCAQ